MEALVMLGRDCRVAWQSEESAKIRRYPIGMPTIGMRLVLSVEEVRDAIYAEKSVRFHDEPLAPEWGLHLLMTRDYHPLFDQDHKVLGMVVLGFSRAPATPSEIDNLRVYRLRPRISLNFPTNYPADRGLPASMLRGSLSRFSKASSTTSAISAAAGALIPACNSASSTAAKSRLLLGSMTGVAGPGDPWPVIISSAGTPNILASSNRFFRRWSSLAPLPPGNRLVRYPATDPASQIPLAHFGFQAQESNGLPRSA